VFRVRDVTAFDRDRGALGRLVGHTFRFPAKNETTARASLGFGFGYICLVGSPLQRPVFDRCQERLEISGTNGASHCNGTMGLYLAKFIRRRGEEQQRLFIRACSALTLIPTAGNECAKACARF
jgi:hypothetical protein